MKTKLRFNQAALKKFFLENVEKIAFALIALVGLWIVYQAFGGAESFAKKPDALRSAADAARKHWESTDAKSIDMGPLPPDYGLIASRSRIPIQVDPYQLARRFETPQFEELSPRGLPELFTVQDLKAVAVRGSTFGQARGLRFIALTGLIPQKEQTDAFQRAFTRALFKEPNRDLPRWSYFEVERAEVHPDTPNSALNWVRLDLRGTRERTEQLGSAGIDPIDDSMRSEILTYPVPMVRDWDYVSMFPPKLTGPLFEEVRKNPDGYRGKRVVWRGSPQPIESRTVVFAAPNTTRRPDDSGTIPHDAYFAVEFPSSHFARAMCNGAGSVMATVVGKKEVEVALNDSGGESTGQRQKLEMPLLRVELPRDLAVPEAWRQEPRLPPGMPLSSSVPLPPADAAVAAYLAQYQQHLKYPPYVLFRFVDNDAEPGKDYRYRVSLYLDNPNFGLPAAYLVDPKQAEERLVRTDWSAPSNPVALPPDAKIILAKVAPGTNPTDAPRADIVIERWLADTGDVVSKEFRVARGDMANFVKLVRPSRTPAESAPSEVDTSYLPEEFSDAVATPKPVGPDPNTFDYVTDAVVVDTIGGNDVAGQVKAPGSILVLEPTGELTVHNEIADRPALDGHNQRLQDLTPQHTTPSHPPAGGRHAGTSSAVSARR